MTNEATRATTHKGVEITRKVIGHSYARNGRLDHANHGTEQVRWISTFGISRTLIAAKELIDEALAAPGRGPR